MIKTEVKVRYKVICNFCGKVLTDCKGRGYFNSLREIMANGHDKGWNFTWDYEKVSCPECDGLRKPW